MTTTQTAAKCLRCSHPLTSLRSIAAGYGPTCSAKIRASAAVSTDKPAQLAKATELIELAAVVPVRANRVFRVTSSDGQHTYLTAATTCSCLAGLHGRRCYHVAAVQIVLAQPAVAHAPIAA